jgi:ATP-binding cassette subfamily F protein 3
VISGLDLTLESGEKLLVAGRNGAGKTTLLRILGGADQDYEGRLTLGAGISIGYFTQDEGFPGDEAASLSGELSVEAYLESQAPTSLIPKLRDLLGAFLFRGDDVHKPLSVLSGGEKSRLALLRMLLEPHNLLILDEPTNHLDLQSKDILLEALQNFPGPLVFVSHDRAFMEALSTKTLELGGCERPLPRLFYGNYAYYLERLDREANQTDPEGGSRRETSSPSSGYPSGGPPPRNAPPLSPAPPGESPREAQKRRQALIRKLEKQEAEVLETLEGLEKEKAFLEAELSRPEVYSNGEKARKTGARLAETAARIEEKTGEWEALAEELQGLG